jgi:ferritin-like metal-binding protein YciE
MGNVLIIGTLTPRNNNGHNICDLMRPGSLSRDTSADPRPSHEEMIHFQLPVMKLLTDLFLDELADMYDAEKRIAKALPKMAKAAQAPELKEAFDTHLIETEGHITKLEEVFALFEEKAKGKTCEATVGLLKEGDDIAAEFKDSPALDAALIAAAQKVEHYEIASYGTLKTWATLLGNEEAAEVLGEILDEEKATDSGLTEIAQSQSNEEAMEEEEAGVGGSKARATASASSGKKTKG